MKKTVVELFAGVGGFRCGLNGIKTIEDAEKPEKWETKWFSQWEPNKKKQHAWDCYVERFGQCFDLSGEDTTNQDIATVDKSHIPQHNLLVGGFPCQDYSVARSLNGEKGIEGKKGVLWWSIKDTIRAKNPPFILLENVDRLLKSPSKQRGRDFGVILACLRDEGYLVEWRVINASEYGFVQRRRRTFIFASKLTTQYAKDLVEQTKGNPRKIINTNGFFARTFAIQPVAEEEMLAPAILDTEVVNVSDNFQYDFQNSGVMIGGIVHTVKSKPKRRLFSRLLGDILETDKVDKKYFVSPEKLYYTTPDVTRSDETEQELTKEQRQTWQYLKGGKKRLRTASNGHQYVFSEGAVPMIDEWDAPARTMLTSESSFNRSSHIVKDKKTGDIRILTPKEAERIQGFPDNWTDTGMPEKFRYFCMGNALVVNLIGEMEKTLDEIFKKEK